MTSYLRHCLFSTFMYKVMTSYLRSYSSIRLPNTATDAIPTPPAECQNISAQLRRLRKNLSIMYRQNPMTTPVPVERQMVIDRNRWCERRDEDIARKLDEMAATAVMYTIQN